NEPRGIQAGEGWHVGSAEDAISGPTRQPSSMNTMSAMVGRSSGSASVILLLNITSLGPPFSPLPRPPLVLELALAGLCFFSPAAFSLSFLRHLKKL
ncbi:hypothetical protein H5410_008585, partial [Solanum commersonii]